MQQQVLKECSNDPAVWPSIPHGGRGHTIEFDPGGGVISEFRIPGEGVLHTVGFDPAGGPHRSETVKFSSTPCKKNNE
jgi:hypothetical protein